MGRSHEHARSLRNRRNSTVFDLTAMDMKFTASVSRYPDNRISELFLDNHKQGSAVGNQSVTLRSPSASRSSMVPIPRQSGGRSVAIAPAMRSARWLPRSTSSAGNDRARLQPVQPQRPADQYRAQRDHRCERRPGGDAGLSRRLRGRSCPDDRLQFTALEGMLSGHADGILLSGPKIRTSPIRPYGNIKQLTRRGGGRSIATGSRRPIRNTRRNSLFISTSSASRRTPRSSRR